MEIMMEKVRVHSRLKLLHRSDAEIILTYNAEMLGMANYYALAQAIKEACQNL